MPRVTVSVNEPVLRWAVERSGRLEALHRKFPNLSEWIQGRKKPTLRQLEAFAHETLIPLGYFFLQEPPEERFPIPFFRTRSDEHPPLPSPDLMETVQTMERRQAWLRDYLIDQGNEPLAFVHSARVTDDDVTVARRIREIVGLGERWASEQPTWTSALKEMQRKIEDAGFLVVVSGVVGNNTHRRLDPREFRGFVLVDEYAPLVFVNGADGKAAQMFTLAHELAHVFVGSSAAFDLRELQPADDETERACNRLAAEFLVPAEEMRAFWSSAGLGPGRYQAAARQFKVSEIVAARRALDLQLATRQEFLDFYQAYQTQEHRRAARGQDGGDFYKTQNMRIGKRFAETVVRATREGKLLYSEAFQLTGLYGTTFDRYAEMLSFGKSA